MRNEYEIMAKINELRSNVQLVEERMQEELALHYRKRDYRLLRFLYKEKSVWEFALSQMEWLLSDKK
jgi:hypothetical protein